MASNTSASSGSHTRASVGTWHCNQTQNLMVHPWHHQSNYRSKVAVYWRHLLVLPWDKHHHYYLASSRYTTRHNYCYRKCQASLARTPHYIHSQPLPPPWPEGWPMIPWEAHNVSGILACMVPLANCTVVPHWLLLTSSSISWKNGTVPFSLFLVFARCVQQAL